MQSVFKKLNEWGCDVSGTMARLSDDAGFFLKCLHMLTQDNNFADLICAIQEKRTADAFLCAHTLKGVLANLGMNPMLDKAVEIVEPLRVGNCENLLSKAEELAAMKDRLREILQEGVLA